MLKKLALKIIIRFRQNIFRCWLKYYLDIMAAKFGSPFTIWKLREVHLREQICVGGQIIVYRHAKSVTLIYTREIRSLGLQFVSSLFVTLNAKKVQFDKMSPRIIFSSTRAVANG